jgi:hypothetical protein
MSISASLARSFLNRLRPSLLQLQARSVLNDIKKDLSWSLGDARQPADAVARYLHISNRVNHLWGCLKNEGGYTRPELRTADMSDAAMAIAREAVCLAAECELQLQADRQAAAEKDWFDAVESEALNDLAGMGNIESLSEKERQENASHLSWGVRLLLIASAVLALSSVAACGGGDHELEEEATVPVPQNLCAANPKACI